MPRRSSLAFLAVFLFALAMLFASVLHHPVYTPDGLAYARFAARDAGRSERDATLEARAFYEQTPLVAARRYRALVEIDPAVAFARSHIFANRVLYPALAAALLPVAGFRGLFLISAVAYVCFGLALFWMLAAFGRFWTALGLTVVALALPLTRTLAASDLTDMLALALWTLALGALMRSMVQGRSNLLLSLLAAASVLLVLTRPTPYLIVLPALTAAILRGLWLELAAASVSVIAFGLTAALTHAFGVREQLQWIYDNEPVRERRPFANWYAGSVAQAARAALSLGIRTVAPALAVLAGVFALVRGLYRDEVWVLLTAFAACLLSLAFNPVPGQIARVVGTPLLPVFCALVQCALAPVPMTADRPQAARGARAS